MDWKKWGKTLAGHGGILAFFVMAFEVMIMISPFAFFFYSVFNPIFKWLDQFVMTRWLTGFFLPHMILPPTLFLQIVRVTGSVLFVMGFLTFFICAAQVYLGKLFKWGVADKGLYKYIRHPQYLTLGIWGIGMAILWPRFIVLASLSLMFILYYYLAKDEERRMTKQFGDSYTQYMERTGMFVPRRIEAFLSRIRLIPNRLPTRFRYVLVPTAIILLIVGAGFILRAITLHSFAYTIDRNITLIAILPEDGHISENVLSTFEKQNDFFIDGRDYLGYVMPADYVMQGMIADTGGEYHLFKQHNTLGMITDWVLSPFEHLRRSPMCHMAVEKGVDPAVARRHKCPLNINDPGMSCEDCRYRRVVFVEIQHDRTEHRSGSALFSFDTRRIPICYADINTETGELVTIQKVGRSTAWKDVPTPAI